MSANIESFPELSREQKLSMLRSVKNELIGSAEMKSHYFDNGLVETLMPMIGKEEDSELMVEIVSILNSFFFHFPRAIDVLKCFSIKLICIVQYLTPENKNQT